MEEYTDIPSVTAETLFGSLGGILNLWIGMTFFTIVEWADLLFIIVGDKCNTKKKVDKENTSVCENNNRHNAWVEKVT